MQNKLHRVVYSMDGLSHFPCNNKTKQQSKQWFSAFEPPPKKTKTVKYAGKDMVTLFGMHTELSASTIKKRVNDKVTMSKIVELNFELLPGVRFFYIQPWKKNLSVKISRQTNNCDYNRLFKGISGILIFR